MPRMRPKLRLGLLLLLLRMVKGKAVCLKKRTEGRLRKGWKGCLRKGGKGCVRELVRRSQACVLKGRLRQEQEHREGTEMPRVAKGLKRTRRCIPNCSLKRARERLVVVGRGGGGLE